MKAFLESRDQGERASWRLQQAKEWIDGTSSTKISLWEVRLRSLRRELRAENHDYNVLQEVVVCVICVATL